MTAELLKAAPLLAKAHPPTSIILVDLRPPDGSIRDDYHGTGGGRRSTSRSDHLLSNPDAALVKRQLSAEFQVPLENGPELRYPPFLPPVYSKGQFSQWNGSSKSSLMSVERRIASSVVC